MKKSKLHFKVTRSMWKMLFLISSLVLLASFSAGAGQLLSPEEAAWLQSHEEPVRVHNERNWKPFNFYESGEAKGYSIDYMKLIADKIGLHIEFVSGPGWIEFLEMMKNGSLDVMVNIASTRERRKSLAFTEPYMITRTSLFVPKSNNSIEDLDDLAGKKIGFTKGFFFGEFIRESYPEIEIITFDSTLDSFLGVENGLVDAAIEVPDVGYQLLQEEKLDSLKEGGVISDPRFITTFSIATRKSNPILLQIIQKGMDAVTPAEEFAIRQKWKIEGKQTSLISKEDRNYLMQLDTLKVCVNPDRLPLEGVSSDGAVTGISSEFLTLLQEQMRIPFTVVQTKTWDETLKRAEAGECDLLPMVSRTEERQKYLSFTAPWLTTPIVIATQQDQIYISNIKQVTGQTFGVVQGLAIREMLHAAYPELKLTPVKNVQEGLLKVKDGSLFGFIGTIPAISRTLQVESITEVKISGDIGLKMNFAAGVKKTDPRLLQIVEKSFAAIDEPEIVNIYNRWLAVAYIDRFDYSRFWQVTAVFILLTVYLLYQYRRGLRVTAELRKAHADVNAINLLLSEQARTDTLTKIANRLKIDEELGLELARYERTGEPFSIILIDIDNFKQVNDRYGHQTGDHVLSSIAEILREKTRINDLAGRWGGEEFLIICPATTREGAVVLAENLRKVIMTARYENLPSQTASFGIATIQPGDSVNDLVRYADEALYRAKKGGRNRVES